MFGQIPRQRKYMGESRESHSQNRWMNVKNVEIIMAISEKEELITMLNQQLLEENIKKTGKSRRKRRRKKLRSKIRI